MPAYDAAEGGMVQFAKALANEWSSQGININEIVPGYMETDNTDALREDPQCSQDISRRNRLFRWGSPADFASTVASDCLHGHVLAVDTGWLAP